MRILILHPKLAWEGGGDRQVLELSSHLQKKGHKVIIFTTEYDYNRCFPEISGKLDIRVVKFNEGRQNEIFDILRAKKIARIIYSMVSKDNERPDIINCHTSPMHWVAVYLKKRINIPVVWMCNDLPPWFLPFLRDRIILRQGIKKLMLTSCKRFMYKTFLPWYDRLLIKDIDRIVVLDRRNQFMIKNAYRKNACIIRSGLDIDKFSQGNREETRKEHSIHSNVFLILSVGLLSSHRRHEDVVMSLALLTAKGYNVKFMVIGGDNLTPGYSEILRNYVIANGMQDKVLLVGSVPDSRLPDYFAASDIFVYPHVNQTWGLAALEAMAAKRPVVISTDTGVSELLVDYETALLVPPKDPELLCNKIAELIDNQKLREKLVSKAYDFVLNNISWDKYSKEILDVFRLYCSDVNESMSEMKLREETPK